MAFIRPSFTVFSRYKFNRCIIQNSCNISSSIKLFNTNDTQNDSLRSSLSLHYSLKNEDLTLVNPSDLALLIKVLNNKPETKSLQLPYTTSSGDSSTHNVTICRLPYVVVDVRPPRDFHADHVPGAISVPWMSSAEFAINREATYSHTSVLTEHKEDDKSEKTNQKEWKIVSQNNLNIKDGAHRQYQSKYFKSKRQYWSFTLNNSDEETIFVPSDNWKDMKLTTGQGGYNSKYGSTDIGVLNRTAESLLFSILNATPIPSNQNVIPVLPKLIIFHCTLSLIRGPKMATMAQSLVSMMRQKTIFNKYHIDNGIINVQPALINDSSNRQSQIRVYPVEISILEGGYKGWKRVNS